VLLGLEAPQDELARAFAAAKGARTVRGFAVGRTIFAEAAKAWFAGAMRDEEAVTDMAARFRALVEIWEA
jgi:5-dehydro-2-deoxygluconokinase